MSRCLDPQTRPRVQTPPEKAFRRSKHLLTRYLADFGRLGYRTSSHGWCESTSLTNGQAAKETEAVTAEQHARESIRIARTTRELLKKFASFQKSFTESWVKSEEVVFSLAENGRIFFCLCLCLTCFLTGQEGCCWVQRCMFY